MNFKKFLKFLICTTVVLLVYVHLQMKIFALAYHTQTSQKQIQELADANGRLTYQLLILKSANNLGKQILEETSNLQFAEQDKVLQLTTQTPSPRSVPSQKPINTTSKAVDRLTKVLTWLTPQTAEAQGLPFKK